MHFSFRHNHDNITSGLHILIAFQSTVTPVLHLSKCRLSTQTHNRHKNIIWQHMNINFKTESLCKLKEAQFAAKPSAAEWSSGFSSSYLVEIAGAAVAVCVVSHPYAGHLCLKEAQVRRKTHEWLLTESHRSAAAHAVWSNAVFRSVSKGE